MNNPAGDGDGGCGGSVGIIVTISLHSWLDNKEKSGSPTFDAGKINDEFTCHYIA
jgi:hypothetical protein